MAGKNARLGLGHRRPEGETKDEEEVVSLTDYVKRRKPMYRRVLLGNDALRRTAIDADR